MLTRCGRTSSRPSPRPEPRYLAASVGSIPNFASVIFASFAPVMTGWALDTTQSFSLPLMKCACVTLAGALGYPQLVRQPITDGE